MEVWKDIPGYEGIYQASNTGKVRTHKNKTTHTERHGFRKWKQRELKQRVSKDNFHRVILWIDGKDKTFLVHRLVAIAFIEKIPGKDYINHLDGDRNNNNVSNLEWCNPKENINHAFDNGLMTSNKEVVLMNLETKEIKEFRSLSKASEHLGYNNGTLSNYLKQGKNEVRGHSIFIK